MKVLWSLNQNTDWTNLLPLTTYKTLGEVDKAIPKCKAVMPKVGKLRDQAFKVRDLSQKAAAKFKTNKLIPKSSADLADAVAKAADHYGVAVKGYDPTKEFEDAKQRVRERVKFAHGQLRKSVTIVENGLNGVDKDTVTFDEWQKFWSGPLRGLQASVVVLPDTKGTPIHLVINKLCS